MAGWHDEREARVRFLLGRLLADVYEGQCAAELFRGAIFYKPDLVEAHVALGIAYCWMEDYEAMLGSFKEAIRLNTQAVRTAVSKEPEEMVALRRALYSEGDTSNLTAKASPVPPYVLEVGRTVEMAHEHLASGRDEEAVEALEHALNIEPSFPIAIALLSLAYLLLQGRANTPGVSRNKSVLNDVAPELATLLFR